MKLKGGKLVKQKKNLKKKKSGLEGPWHLLHEHTFWHILKPSSAQVADEGGGDNREIQEEHGHQRTSIQR